MKRKHNFTLIDGTFTPADAGRILLDLVSRKISYHSMENFSAQERFSRNAAHSEMRVESLKKLKDSLKEFFVLAEKKGVNLKVDGLIEITIIEN